MRFLFVIKKPTRSYWFGRAAAVETQWDVQLCNKRRSIRITTEALLRRSLLEHSFPLLQGKLSAHLADGFTAEIGKMMIEYVPNL